MMDLGDKLRVLRQQRNLTQPELAAAMGIEQSYLSKLENGKSIPSGDVLSRILDEFNLEIGDLVDELDQGIRSQLRQIPDVARHFDQQKRLLIGNRRRWLMASTVLLAFGAALIYGGLANLFVSATVYNYESRGIVLDGESKEVFGRISGTRADEGIQGRLDEDYAITRSYRGQMFNVPVEGGSRTYYITNRFGVDPWQNKALAALGVFLSVLGVTGVVLEKKLSRFQ